MNNPTKMFRFKIIIFLVIQVFIPLFGLNDKKIIFTVPTRGPSKSSYVDISIFTTTPNPTSTSTLPISTDLIFRGETEPEYNCEDILSKEEFPEVNITDHRFSVRQTIKFIQPNHIRLPNAVGEWNYECKATYPIEWVFHTEQQLNSEEIRDWIVGASRIVKDGDLFNKSAYIYSIRMKLAYKKPAIQSKITCRSIQNPICLQTLIQLKKNEMNNLNIYFSRDPGRIIDEPILYGRNPRCDLNIRYDVGEQKFICDYFGVIVPNVPEFNHLSMDNINCNGQLSCKGLFNPNKGNCPERNETPKMKSSLNGINSNPIGFVVCQYGASVLDKDSATLHYFFSTPNLCPNQGEGSNIIPKIYFDWEKVDRNEFLHICPPSKEIIYTNQSIEIHCISSAYYFSEGIQWVVKNIESGIDVVIGLGIHSRDQFTGTRSSKLIHRFENMSKYSIACYAPIWNSSEYFSKSVEIEILKSSPIKFIGGSEVEIISLANGVKEIICQAEGFPVPKLTWKRYRQPLTSGNLTISFEEGLTKIKFNPNATDIFGEYKCIASNPIEKVEKYFVVQPKLLTQEIQKDTEDPLSKNFNAEDFLSKNWMYILGGSILLLLVIIMIFLFLCLKIRKQKGKLKILSKGEIQEFFEGRPEALKKKEEDPEMDTNSYAPFLPYNANYEVSLNQLEIDRNTVLGSGAYGIVYLGILKKNPEETGLKSAIKTIKPFDDINCFKSLLAELKIMGHVGQHPNIVNLLGAFTKNIQKREIYIALEFCDNGNLLQYLRKNRDNFGSLINQDGQLVNETSFSISNEIPNRLSTFNLIKWSLEIANGMEFLSTRKIIHGDIAARNILLNGIIAKIGDFGLSKQLFEYANYYIKRNMTPLPWKWLALECLEDMNFSIKSDCWAFGITLWEIFSLGKVPYVGFNFDDNFVKKLHSGYRMERPEFATEEIFEFITSCWKDQPFQRPNFSTIRMFFENFLRNHFQFSTNIGNPDYTDMIQSDAVYMNDSIPIAIKEKFDFS